MLIISSDIPAQETMKTDQKASQSVEGIVHEVLRLLNGEAGKSRNWDAIGNLFFPEARLFILNHGKDFPDPVESVSLEEFIALLHDPYYEKGFTETETGRIIEEYNGIAHVFQSFYARDAENTEERGINSYQLVFADGRWWILNLLWTGDSNGVRVPDKYLND